MGKECPALGKWKFFVARTSRQHRHLLPDRHRHSAQLHSARFASICTEEGAPAGDPGVLAVGQGIAHPSLSAFTSKLVGPDQVGGVMGVYQGMSSLARIIGPFWGEVVYGAIGYAWPFRTGPVFMLMACVVAVVALLRLRKLPATAV